MPSSSGRRRSSRIGNRKSSTVSMAKDDALEAAAATVESDEEKESEEDKKPDTKVGQKEKSSPPQPALSSTTQKLNKSKVGHSGLMMILSPAKTLDMKPLGKEWIDILKRMQNEENETMIPACDVERTKEVAIKMKSKSKSELEKLLALSSKVAATSHEHWSDFETEPNRNLDDLGHHKPAALSFAGPAYQGLDATNAWCLNNASARSYLQQHLRIIDPLYGVLRPFDVVQPYRLEMAVRNLFPEKKLKGTLSNYWKEPVTQFLRQELQGRPSEQRVVVNLASDEYASAVDPAALGKDETRFVKVVFHQEGKVVSFAAKRARGLMARYISQNQLTSVDEMKNFDWEGYKFKDKNSEKDKLVFDRPKPTPVKSSKKSKKDSGGEEEDAKDKKKSKRSKR